MVIEFYTDSAHAEPWETEVEMVVAGKEAAYPPLLAPQTSQVAK